MKQLYPAQERAKNTLLQALEHHSAALDASQTGLGKTVVACHVAAETGRPVGVLCPKIVIPSWERELKESGVRPLFVMNYEKIRNGRTKWLSKKNKRMYTWNLPPDTTIIVDECHKAKAIRSQTSALHIAATRQGVRTLNLSATAAVSPPDMRALGFALGLHSDMAAKVPGKPSFETWLRKHGCFQDPWRNWQPGSRKHLVKIHEALFEGEVPRAVRLTVDDLPAAFKGNLVLSNPLDFGPELRKAYETAMDSFEIDWSDYKHLKPEHLESTAMLLEMSEARQTAEMLKVPHIVEMAEDLLAEGKSVAIFVNYSQTLDRILEQLPGSAVIRGGQNAAEREANVNLFQSDQARVVVANIAAGGAGVSLHDVRGEFPRASIISPSFNLVDLVQTLGRVYRNGMKSPCVQHVLIAEGTIEESIGEALKEKSANLSILLDGGSAIE